MSIKDEFESGLGGVMSNVEQGDISAEKSILYAGSFQHPEPIGNSIVVPEKEYELLRENTTLLAELKELTLYGCFCRLPELLADIDKKSYRGMSKRRKKRFLSRLRMFETSTGKLASVKHLGKKGFKSIPMIHVFVESSGIAFENFMDQWLGLIA